MTVTIIEGMLEEERLPKYACFKIIIIIIIIRSSHRLGVDESRVTYLVVQEKIGYRYYLFFNSCFYGFLRCCFPRDISS